MKTPKPRGFDSRRARTLLARARPLRTVPARVEAVSEALLGCPYEGHGLVGSAETPEELVAPLDRFDCVTYVETALALARASDPASFAEELRRIRYEGGVVEWARRNHYMVDWARENTKARRVWPVAAEKLAKMQEKVLDAVPGLPARASRFWCVPKSKLRAFEPRLASGDILLFASTKRTLDVFHCGLLVRTDGRSRLRHASLSSGRVVEDDLASFLRANRMAGLIALRPLEANGPAPALGRARKPKG